MKTSSQQFTALGTTKKEARENLKKDTQAFTKNIAWRFSKRPSFKGQKGGWMISATVEWLVE
jgi:hypothetical protein